METTISYTDGTAYVSTDEKKLANKIRKLAEARPDDVHILADGPANDNCLYCTLPSEWVRIRVPATYSPEQMEAFRELGKRASSKLHS